MVVISILFCMTMGWKFHHILRICGILILIKTEAYPVTDSVYATNQRYRSLPLCSNIYDILNAKCTLSWFSLLPFIFTSCLVIFQIDTNTIDICTMQVALPIKICGFDNFDNYHKVPFAFVSRTSVNCHIDSFHIDFFQIKL